MNDDMGNFKDVLQKSQVKKYGVTVDPYTPHVTAYYINLPNEPKTIKLDDVAEILNADLENDAIYNAEYIALVELGLNGNAIEIIEQVSLIGD